PSTETDGVNQGELFPFGANAPPGQTEADAMPQEAVGWKGTYHLVDTDKKFAAFLKELKKQTRFAVDLETTGLDPLLSDIVGLAFSWQAGEGWYLAVRGPASSPTLDPDKTLKQLKPILENPRVEKVNQNIKYDLLALRKHGISVQGVAGDS